MKAKYALPALAALLLLPAAFVQAQGTAPAELAAGKVGTLNVRQAIANTAEGKQAQAELQSQFAPRQNELENLRKQAEDMQNRGRQATVSDEERARLGRQMEVLSRQYQRKSEDLQEDINAAQNEVIERIGQKVIEVLNRYARENGFTVVLDVSQASTPVMFASPSVDVTQDIIRLYDQANPIRGAAPTPAPQQPRPAQPGQTRPPQQQQPPPKPPTQ